MESLKSIYEGPVTCRNFSCKYCKAVLSGRLTKQFDKVVGSDSASDNGDGVASKLALLSVRRCRTSCSSPDSGHSESRARTSGADSQRLKSPNSDDEEDEEHDLYVAVDVDGACGQQHFRVAKRRYREHAPQTGLCSSHFFFRLRPMNQLARKYRAFWSTQWDSTLKTTCVHSMVFWLLICYYQSSATYLEVGEHLFINECDIRNL